MPPRARLDVLSLAVFASFLVVVAVVAVWERGTDRATPPPADSPDAVVATYVAAILAGDVALARSTFDASLAARCSAARLSRIVAGARDLAGHDVTSRIVGRGTLSDGRLRIDVRFVTTWVEPPFSVGEDVSTASFTLHVVDDVWQMTTVGWPEPCP